MVIIKNLLSKKYFKKLLLIKKLFLLEEEDCDIYYNNSILDITKELVKKEELKNNDLYDLIEVNDIFIMNREGDYPMEIFKEFNLNNIEDDFYEKWNKIIPKKNWFNNNMSELIRIITNKIEHMKDFGKLFKLFNWNDEEIINHPFNIFWLNKRYKELLKNDTHETCPNLAEETAFLIFIMDKHSELLGLEFLQDIKNNISSVEVLNNIYWNLLEKYELSRSISKYLNDFFMEKLELNYKFKLEHIPILIKMSNSPVKKKLINEFHNYIIKEEELFNNLQSVISKEIEENNKYIKKKENEEIKPQKETKQDIIRRQLLQKIKNKKIVEIIEKEEKSERGDSKEKKELNIKKKEKLLLLLKNKNTVEDLENEIEMKNKEINELKMKLARYPFVLFEKEKIITVIFSSMDEDIIFPFICKNTDFFSDIAKKFYEKFPEYRQDNIFMVNGNKIDEDKNLIQNKIDDGSIIEVVKIV